MLYYCAIGIYTDESLYGITIISSPVEQIQRLAEG